MGSLDWLVAYAADEYACSDVPQPPKRLKGSERLRPNCGRTGLWTDYEHHTQRWQFEFVEAVPGLEPEDKHIRRYFHLASLTDLIWAEHKHHVHPLTLPTAAGRVKVDVALRFVYAWADAILAGRERPFLDRYFGKAANIAFLDTAPAATGAPLDHAVNGAGAARADGDNWSTVGGVDDSSDLMGSDSEDEDI